MGPQLPPTDRRGKASTTALILIVVVLAAAGLWWWLVVGRGAGTSEGLIRRWVPIDADLAVGLDAERLRATEVYRAFDPTIRKLMATPDAKAVAEKTGLTPEALERVAFGLDLPDELANPGVIVAATGDFDAARLVDASAELLGTPVVADQGKQVVAGTAITVAVAGPTEAAAGTTSLMKSGLSMTAKTGRSALDVDGYDEVLSRIDPSALFWGASRIPVGGFSIPLPGVGTLPSFRFAAGSVDLDDEDGLTYRGAIRADSLAKPLSSRSPTNPTGSP